MPWCDICIQSKSRDDFHRRARPKVLPVIQFEYAVAGTHQGQPHFDFMVRTDMSTGAAWASAVLIKGKEDPYIVSSIISWVFRARTLKSHHPVTRWVSVRSRHAHGTVKRRNDGKPTVRDHPTAVTTIQSPEQRRCRTDGTDHTQSNQSVQQQQHVLPKPNPACWRGSCMQTTRSIGQQTRVSVAWRHLARTWQQKPNGMVRSRALKHRVERRQCDPSLLNPMVWDPWNPRSFIRGRPFKVRSNRAPILMGPIPRGHLTPPNDPDTLTTAAVPIEETTPGTTTTPFAAERTRVRLPQAEAEGATPVQRTKTSSAPVTITAETTSQTTTSSARALVERVGNEADEDLQPAQMRRIATLMAECEDSSTSDDIAGAQRTHPEKLTKVNDAIIKVVPRTDATTKPLTGRWVDTVHDDGVRKSGGRHVDTSKRWTKTRTSFQQQQQWCISRRCWSTQLRRDTLQQSETAAESSTNRLWTRTERRTEFGSSLLQRQSWDQTTSGKPCQHFHVSREHRELGIRTVRTFSQIPCRWSSHETTGACSIVSNQVENKSRRKQGDTSMTSWWRDLNRTSNAFWHRREKSWTCKTQYACTEQTTRSDP